MGVEVTVFVACLHSLYRMHLIGPVCWQALAELSESPEVITQKPSFIVFMEGGDKDEQVGDGTGG